MITLEKSSTKSPLRLKDCEIDEIGWSTVKPPTMRTSTLCLALAALAASPASAFAPPTAPSVLFSKLGASCKLGTSCRVPPGTNRLRPAFGVARLAASGAVIEDNEAKIAESLALLYRAADTKKVSHQHKFRELLPCIEKARASIARLTSE